MKKAFTMLELVMVMVIMGIIASIGADIIASMYSNYLRSRTINRLESQTEITLEQIAKRLQYRIKESTIARSSSDNAFLAIPSYDGTQLKYNSLEWIGYSNESFLGNPQPGWSGFIDLDSIENNSSSGNQRLKTSESNLTYAEEIIFALTNGDINITNQDAGLIFKGKASNVEDFCWRDSGSNINTPSDSVITVRKASDTLFQLTEDVSEIYEQYYLAHTAYAIVPEGNITAMDYNLTLYYNYQPWLGEDYNTSGTPTTPLAEHVSLFRFKQDDTILQLKLCLHDNNETGVGERIVICKEKVVY